MVAALAVLSIFASCSREQEPEIVPGRKMTVQIQSAGTKTTAAYDNESGKYKYSWTVGDKLGVFARCYSEDLLEHVPSSELDAPTAHAVFTATVTAPRADATYDFYTYYPYNAAAGNDYRHVSVVIPATQQPANDAFDPAADVLAGYPVSRSVVAEAASIDDLEVSFARKTALVRITPTYAGSFDGISAETCVSSIIVGFDKPVVGTASMDLTENDDLVLGSDAGSRVTLQYAANTQKLTDPIWLSIAPVSGIKALSFDFEVAEGVYLHGEAQIGGDGLSFAAASQKKFTVPIDDEKWALKAYETGWVKVAEAPESWNGQYLIVYEGASVAFDGSAETLDKAGNYFGVEIADGRIAGDYAANSFTIAAQEDGSCTIRSASGFYIGRTASSNGMNVDANTAYTNTLTFEDGVVKVTGNDANGTATSARLKYYNSGSNSRFRYYATAQNDIALYKYVDETVDVRPVIADPDPAIEMVDAAGVTDETFAVAVLNLGTGSVSVDSYDGTVVTAASVVYADGVATVTYSVSANSGDVREGTITLKAGETTKEIVIAQESGIILPEMSEVADQEVGYAAGSHTFDITILNVGENEVSAAGDGTVVTEASVELLAGNVYTVTYTVSANEGTAARTGKVTVSCLSVSEEVTVNQGFNTAGVRIFKRVTALKDVTPGQYIIVASTSTQTGYLPTAATSAAPVFTTTGLSIDANDQIAIAEASFNDYAWAFTGTATAMTIAHNSLNVNLYCTGANNGVRVGGTADTWTIAAHGSGEASVFQFQEANNSRFLGVYNNQDWRSYTTYDHSNYAGTGSSKIKLYKYDDPRTDPTILTDNAAITTLGSCDVADLFVSDSDGEMSFEVSGGTLSGTTFTADEAGEYTVTMTQAETDAFRAASASATITVTTAPTLSTPEILAEGDNNARSISVMWDAVANATAYTVYCNGTAYAAGTSLSYTLEDLDYDVAYTISVKAEAAGYYPATSASQTVTLQDPASLYLAVPAIVAAAEGTTITVMWEDVANATSYVVTCTGLESETVAAGVEGCSFTDVPAGSYTVTVTAKADGYEDGVSEPEVVEVFEALVMTTVSCIAQTTGSLTFSWNAVANAAAENGYEVSTDQVAWTTVSGTSYVLGGLAPNTSYTLYVRAKANGYYTASAVVSCEGTTEEGNDGSQAHPYTCTEAYEIITGGSASSDSKYVSGIVSSIKSTSVSSGKITYWISQDGSTTNQIQVYNGYYLNNTNFTAVSQIAVGDEVVVYGQLLYYNNATPELNSGNYLYALNGKNFALTAGSLSTAVDNDNLQITVVWGAASGAESISYVVSCGTQTYNASAAGSHTFTMEDYGQYDISVVASAANAISATAATTATLSDPNETPTTQEYLSTFTTKAWATASDPQWTSGKDGNQFQNGRGIQVTSGASGANATTNDTFTNVTAVEVTYSTNASKGAGSIAIQVGDADAESQAVTKTGGTADRTLTFTPDASGVVNITVTCTENSIYIKSVKIIAQ
ncbi:MAG: hypothetical protein J5871_04590 [Bacteroidales bacterium]|nr:hypothetical protein [Bacteroidales bacterium]